MGTAGPGAAAAIGTGVGMARRARCFPRPARSAASPFCCSNAAGGAATAAPGGPPGGDTAPPRRGGGRRGGWASRSAPPDRPPARVHGVLTDDRGGWTYQTVLANAAAPLAAAAISEETREVAWVPVSDVERLPLHPGFAGQWAALRAALTPLTIIVDAANV